MNSPEAIIQRFIKGKAIGITPIGRTRQDLLFGSFRKWFNQHHTAKIPFNAKQFYQIMSTKFTRKGSFFYGVMVVNIDGAINGERLANKEIESLNKPHIVKSIEMPSVKHLNCPKCPMKYERETAMKHHMILKHRESLTEEELTYAQSPSSYKCKYCDRSHNSQPAKFSHEKRCSQAPATISKEEVYKYVAQLKEGNNIQDIKELLREVLL